MITATMPQPFAREAIGPRPAGQQQPSYTASAPGVTWFTGMGVRFLTASGLDCNRWMRTTRVQQLAFLRNTFMSLTARRYTAPVEDFIRMVRSVFSALNVHYSLYGSVGGSYDSEQQLSQLLQLINDDCLRQQYQQSSQPQTHAAYQRAAGQATLPGPDRQPAVTDLAASCAAWLALGATDHLMRVKNWFIGKGMTVTNADINTVIQNINYSCQPDPNNSVLQISVTPPTGGSLPSDITVQVDGASVPTTGGDTNSQNFQATGLSGGQHVVVASGAGYSATQHISLDRSQTIQMPIQLQATGPIPLFPHSGSSTMHSAPLRFSWDLPTGAPGISNFQLMICSDATMQAGCIDTTAGQQGFMIPGTDKQTFILVHPGTYAWAIRWKDAAGNLSPYSTPIPFTVDAAVTASLPGDVTRGRQYFQTMVSASSGFTCAAWSAWSHISKAHAMDPIAPGAGSRAVDPSEPGFEDARVEQAIVDVDAYCRSVAPVSPQPPVPVTPAQPVVVVQSGSVWVPIAAVAVGGVLLWALLKPASAFPATRTLSRPRSFTRTSSMAA